METKAGNRSERLGLVLPYSLAGYLLYYVGTGIRPLQGAGQAINDPAWASILLLVVGIRNAWDLVVWMILSEREPSQSE